MKDIKRIAAFVLVICMLASVCVFAVSAKASIVSPAASSVVSGDSLLVSVKVADKNSVKVYVYEEKESISDSKTKQTTLAGVDVSKMTEAAIQKITADYISTAAIIASEAALYHENDAAKISEAALNKTVQKYVDTEYVSPASFTANGDLGFFTKQLSGVKPGLYRILVDTVDKDGNVIESTFCFAAVKEKAQEVKTDLFETQQTGAMQFLSNLLKTIFK